MGHYYADLMCDKCGKIRCICPPKPEAPDTSWVIHPDTYKVVRTVDYDKEFLERPGIGRFHLKSNFSPMAHRVLGGIDSYKTKKEAEQKRAEFLKEAIKEAKEELETLQKYLKE